MTKLDDLGKKVKVLSGMQLGLKLRNVNKSLRAHTALLKENKMIGLDTFRSVTKYVEPEARNPMVAAVN